MKIQSTNYINYTMRSNTVLKKSNGANIRFGSLDDDGFYAEAKAQQKKKRHQVHTQRMIALFSALGLGAAGTVGTIVNVLLPDDNKNVNPDPTTGIYGEPFEDTTDSIFGDDSEFVVTNPEEEESVPFEETLATNAYVREEYDKINDSLNTFSEHLGEDGFSLILDKVDEIGDGKVDPIEVLKILYLESTGRIYSDKEKGTLLKSNSGAYGAFQVMEDTADYMNNYFGLKGTEKELDVKNPYDNLEACIYTLRFLAEKRGAELNKGMNLPTGNDLKAAVAWSYHDGAWATSISDRGESYLTKYHNLDVLNEYPEIIDYLAE